jgi:Ion channel
VRDFKKIAKRYIFHGSFIADFAAVFPLSAIVGA